MRVVFDTNIFVSAFTHPHGRGEQAYLLAVRGTVRLYSSPAIILEVAVTLREKFDALRNEADVLDEILDSGAVRARAIADRTMRRVREATGISPRRQDANKTVRIK